MDFIGVNVNERKGDDSDFAMFELREVNYIELYKPKRHSESIPVYHTSHGSYAPLLTLRDLSAALTPHGFHSFDQSTLVNTIRIKNIVNDEYGVKLIFIDQKEVYISKKSKR